MQVFVECFECKEYFLVKPYLKYKAKFCSNICKNIFQKQSMRGNKNPSWKNKLEIKCKNCNEIFKVVPSRIDAIFCSTNCFGKYNRGDKNSRWRGGPPKCIDCNILLNSSDKNYKRCKCCYITYIKSNIIQNKCKDCGLNINKENNLCRKCWKENNKGENHPNWRGGKSSNQRKMNTDEYKNWRKSIFERDDYTCQVCDNRGVFLEAHHIKRWKDYKELRFEINNGITLCKSCHSKTKGKEKDYEEFLENKIKQNYIGISL